MIDTLYLQAMKFGVEQFWQLESLLDKMRRVAVVWASMPSCRSIATLSIKDKVHTTPNSLWILSLSHSKSEALQGTSPRIHSVARPLIVCCPMLAT